MPQEYTFLRRSKSYKYFELRDSSGVVRTLNDKRVRELLSSGRVIIHGLKLSSDNRILIDRKKDEIVHTTNTKRVLNDIGYTNKHIESYSGTALKSYIETNLIGVSECRDFVKSVISILTQPIQDKRVLGIAGLRGVGKTTGIWQSIQRLNKYEDTVYINVLDDDAIDYSELYTFITKNYPDKRYIFIDEITFVRDFIKASKSLYEKFITNGKYVVISGTDSLALSQAKGNGLYHRIFIKNVTFISYNEAVRVTGVRGYKEYLELGGLFKDDFIESSAGLNEYINTAVVDNIYNTLCKNPNVTSLASLYVFGTESGKEKIRTIIYMILSAIVYSLSEKRKSLSADFIVNLFEDTEAYGRDDMRDLLSSSIGVSLSNGYTKQDIVPILSVLVEMNVLLRIENYAERGTYNYYITNQSIFNQMISSMIGVLKARTLQMSEGATLKSRMELLFESSIVNHTALMAKRKGLDVYYYHDSSQAEIDLIVHRGDFSDAPMEEDSAGGKNMLFEIKMTESIDTAIIKSIWLNSENIKIYGETVDKYIIYGGENAIFKGFSTDVYPPKGHTVHDIEIANMNTKLIGVKQYLEGMQDYFKILVKREE